MEKKIKIILSFAFFLSGFLLWQDAQAADYYVSPTGGASKLGTYSDPYLYTNIPWTNFESGGTDNTIYFLGGTYTENLAIRHRSTSNTLYLKPCSASSNPSGCDSQVIFSSVNGGNIVIDGISDNITIDGETTVGAGTRNIKVIPGNGIGIENSWASAPTLTEIVLKYLEVTGLDTGTEKVWGGDITSIYAININSMGAGSEIAYNYIHDNWGHSDIIVTTAKDDYGIVSIHHNTFERGTANYIFTTGGLDIYDNIFDAHDAIFPYDIIHVYTTDGIRYLRIYNNYFDTDDQMIFLENATDATECSGSPCKTEHIRIYNNVFTCTVPTTHENVFFGGRTILIENADTAGFVDDFYIVNNTFANVHYAADMSGAGSGVTTYTNFKVINNICYENSSDSRYNASACMGYQGGINWTSESAAIFDYNLLYDNDSFETSWMNAPNGIMTNYTSLATFESDWVNYSHNINENPVFAETVDYTIGSSSNAKDVGLDLSALTDMDSTWPSDKNGNARSGDWDIGAYEYVSETSDTIAPAAPSGLSVN